MKINKPAVATAVSPWSLQQGGTTYSKYEAQAFARKMLGSPSYRTDLEKRLLAGTLPAALEIMLFHYAYGKPVENIALTVNDEQDFSEMSSEELLEASEKLNKQLQEVLALENALQGELLAIE